MILERRIDFLNLRLGDGLGIGPLLHRWVRDVLEFVSIIGIIPEIIVLDDDIDLSLLADSRNLLKSFDHLPGAFGNLLFHPRQPRRECLPSWVARLGKLRNWLTSHSAIAGKLKNFMPLHRQGGDTTSELFGQYYSKTFHMCCTLKCLISYLYSL